MSGDPGSRAQPPAPAGRRAAERHVMRALRRMHTEQPLVADFRADAVVARALETPRDARPASHRGAGADPLTPELAAAALDGLVERGEVVRDGRRVRLPDRHAGLAPEMRAQADAMIGRLRATAPAVPPLDRVAREFGIPAPVVDYLRRSGELVSIGPGLDYPADVLARLIADVTALMAAEGPLSVGRYRDALGTGRRHAVALLEHFDAIGVTRRDDELRVPAKRAPERDSGGVT